MLLEGNNQEEQSRTAHILHRILYVEDEPDIQMVVQISLEAAGYKLEICSSGYEALQKAVEFKPDLILLDVMMPGMDGPATLKELRQIFKTQSTPVVFMTAKVQKLEIEEYIKLGALEVITKPFDPLALASDLERIWKKHSSHKIQPDPRAQNKATLLGNFEIPQDAGP